MNDKPLLIVPATMPRDSDQVELKLPRIALQALFDLLSALKPGEMRDRLRTFTLLPEHKLHEAEAMSDLLYDFLWQQGMRPRAVRREYLGLARKLTGKVYRLGN